MTNKNVIYPFLRYPWPPNLAGWWFVIRNCKLRSPMSMVMWGHMKNENSYLISVSMRSVATKSDRMIAYEKDSPPIIVAWQNGHMTSKNFFQIGSWLPNMTRWWFVISSYRAQSHMILWLHNIRIFFFWQRENVISAFLECYGQQIGKGGGLGHGTTTQEIISLLVKLSFHYSFSTPVMYLWLYIGLL